MTTVNGNIRFATNNAPSSAVITFSLSRWDRQDVVLLPGVHDAQANINPANGAFSILLWSNDAGQYDSVYLVAVTEFYSGDEFTGASHHTHSLGAIRVPTSGPVDIRTILIDQVVPSKTIQQQFDQINADLAAEEAARIAKDNDLQLQITAFETGVHIVGDWNPATGSFPSTPSPIRAGDQWNVIGTGTVGGVMFAPGDIVTALRDSPSGATYAGHWSKRFGTATAADQVTTAAPGVTVQDALNMSVPDVQTLLDSTTAYAVGTVIYARREGVSFQVAAVSASDHDNTTDGGVKLYRLRRKRLIFAYSQSNFAGKDLGVDWTTEPPANLFVWNGGNWQPGAEGPGFVPPIGDAFVPASDMVPQVPIAYAAELAEGRPDEDWYLVILARGGTGVRALVGHRYRWSDATAGAVGTADIRLNAAATEIAYSETDILGYSRFIGGTDIGVSTLYPARLETVADGGARWIEFFVTGEETDLGDYRTQPITVTSDSSWATVAEDEGVRLYPGEPRMAGIAETIMPLVFAAMNLTGDNRKIDRLLIWPTEADNTYHAAYAGVDFDQILVRLSSWLTPNTKILMTLPQPYGVGIDNTVKPWWSAIKAIAARDPDMRTVVSLANSGAENWGDTNNIHAIGTGREVVGRLMRISEETGGTPLSTVASGTYTPTYTGVANVDSITPFEARWMQIGDIVSVQGRVQIDPTSSTTATSLRISLPVPSDILTTGYLGGMAVASNVDDHTARVESDTVNDAALLNYTSRISTPSAWVYDFSYRIRPI